MADEIPGGYFHELNQKGEIVRAHNARGEEVELLSDEQIQRHTEEGTPAPLKSADSPDAAVKAEQQAAAGSGKSGGKSGRR